jgi:predicted nucleic acid-binding protein
MSAGETPRVLAFADTNVWLYALLETQDAVKCARAREIIRDTGLIVSTQVINEVCFNLLRKAKFTEERIQELVASFYSRHRVIAPGEGTFLAASRLRSRHQFSFWDSLMIAAALEGGATTFFSEDMHDGLLVDNRLRISNPFQNLTAK